MMERLTFRKNEKTYVRLNNLCFADRQVAERMMCSGCHIHINDTWRENEDYRKKCGPLAVIDRLADYEDLGTVEALYALVKAKEEGRLIPYGPGDAVWDRFGRIWGVSSSEIRLLDGKPTPMYRCGHPGTDDYCALWAHEALDKEAGAKAAKVWAAEIATYFPCKAVTRVEAQAALERVEKHLASCTNPDCPYQPTKNCPAADGCGGYAALERMEET